MNRSASTDESPDSRSSFASDENGTLRPSRSEARLRGVGQIRKIQVFSEERPSKRPMPEKHAKPRILHHLLGYGARAHESSGNSQHRRPELLDELDKDSLVAIAQRGDDPDVVHGGLIGRGVEVSLHREQR